MSQPQPTPSNFFTRESSWTLSHENGESHVVVFSTQNGLALAVLVYIDGHLHNANLNSRTLTTRHFTATSADDAKKDAIAWARENIDDDLRVSQAP